jgi:hypothetical protein
MRTISLAPALKLTAVQLRELGTVVRTHYEESVIERSETLEKSTLGDVNCCFGQGKGHRVRIVRSDVSHGASICSAHHPIRTLFWGKDNLIEQDQNSLNDYVYWQVVESCYLGFSACSAGTM